MLLLFYIVKREYLNQEAEQHTGGTSRTDDTSYVGAHGIHEQVVGGVGLLALVVRDAGGHGHGRHTGIADERVDLLALREEEVHELHEQHATGSSDDEGGDTYELYIVVVKIFTHILKKSRLLPNMYNYT